MTLVNNGSAVKGIRYEPIVDKPAAVAKAPFVAWFHYIRVTTKRDLLTLAKDSMAGIMSDI